MSFKRVHIFGGAGSGKTTLAKRYSDRFDTPHYELDDIYYLVPAARTRRQPSDRDQLLADAVSENSWVLDGIFWQPWVRPSLARADKIIVLAIPELTRHSRVVARHFRFLRNAPPCEWKYFFPTLTELLRHNRTYDRGPLRETVETTSDFREKVSICKTNAEAAMILGL